MSKVLASKVAGREGMWTRVELDSGEVVLVSLANTIRLYAMKRRFLSWSVGDILCEIESIDAIRAAKLKSEDPLGLGTELLAWATGVVMAMPTAALSCSALRTIVAAHADE